MPPKRSSTAVNNSRPSSKRASESPLMGLGKKRKHKQSKSLSDEPRTDPYCWICHKLARDQSCKTCSRVYHTDCLKKEKEKFSVEEACPECQLESVDGQKLSKFLTIDKLQKVLAVARSRVYKRNQDTNEKYFQSWPTNIRGSKIVRIIDFEVLLDNINDTSLPYTRTAEFYSDVKWIHHNCYILYGADSDVTKASKRLVNNFQKEILEIEECPKCYFHMYADDSKKDDFFVKICDPPHDIIWARLKSYAHWPAKCLKVVSGKAYVRFFGTHDKSHIDMKDETRCLFLSLDHPRYNSKLTDENLVPKRKDYRIAVDELLFYIDRYKRKFGKEFKFYDRGTPYKYEMAKPRQERTIEDSHNVPAFSNIQRRRSTSSVIEGNNSLTDQGQDENQVPSENSTKIIETNSDVINTQPNISPAEPVLSERVHNNSIITNISSSPVLSASMTCEVDECEDVHTCINSPSPQNTLFNCFGDPTFPGGGFRPLAASTSTPIVTATASLTNFSQQLSTISASRSYRQLTDNTALFFQEEPRSILYESHPVIPTAMDLIPGSDMLASGSDTSPSSVNVDDDVVCLGASARNHQNRLKASSVLPYIFNDSPDMQSLIRNGKCVFDNLLLRVWAHANRCPTALDLISKMNGDIMKLCAERNRLRTENKKLEQNRFIEKRLQEENGPHQEENEKLHEENRLLKTKLFEEEKRFKALEKEKEEALENARSVIDGTHNKYLSQLKSDTEDIVRANEQKLQEKDNLIKEGTESIKRLKAEVEELKAKNQEVGEAYKLKLEELLKLQKEKMSWETRQEVKGIVVEHLNNLGLKADLGRNSIVKESNGSNCSTDSLGGNRNCSTTKSQKSSIKSQSRANLRRSSLGSETTTADQQFCQRTVSQQNHVQTVQRKTGVSLRLEHTSEMITTTRTDGNMFAFNRPVTSSLDVLVHASHRDRFLNVRHSASPLLPTPKMETSSSLSRSQSKRRQSRFTQ